MAKRILMIVGDMTEELEAFMPFQAFQMVGYEVGAVCPGKKLGDKILMTIHDFAPGI